MDAFFEAYHIGKLHTATIDYIFYHMATAFDAFGRNHRMVLPRRKIDRLRDQPEDEWDILPSTAVVYCMFPNTIIVHQADHIEIFRCFPGDSPAESRAIITVLTPEKPKTESAVKHWQNNIDLLLAAVQGEDFPAGETIQTGISSGAFEHFVWGRYELAMEHFHKSIKELLGRPPLITRDAAE